MQKYLNSVFLFISLVSCSCINQEYANFSGKCREESRKLRECRMKNLLLCEYAEASKGQKRTGTDSCTNADIWMFPLIYFCQKSVDCGGSGGGINNGTGIK